MTYPATGQIGTGNIGESTTYIYPGGPATSPRAFDENGNQVRQTVYSYGPEGDELSVTGSTEPVSYSYDALYRTSTLTDGNGNTTHYYYNKQGYLDSMTYPGYTGPTPAYNAVTGGWSIASGVR